eukprot:Blabericola_migrator_1__883@NODE_1217_length_5093_cov_73_346797_g826_i0_p2_GENE_NODE_1217_length_5093_cov_73_346797_g826_i0NODE_1217_length_5093_cov_73_346797_g826_i0_p2_ORF_typecomplete_len326_score38_43HhHGPD/PF00730_25/1_6e13OGG_N/PF07934_12/5_4e06HHH/PF00633_23/0_16_NODE_1217_length_5093_cov_73_346797_g826_i021003077
MVLYPGLNQTVAKASLCGGQAFRWISKDDGSFEGVIGTHLYCVIDDTYCCVLHDQQDCEKTFISYMGISTRDCIERLDVLSPYIVKLMATDPPFDVRFLNQDPLEVLVSFLLSSNCNIKRIERMVRLFSQTYGTPLTECHSIFPSLSQIIQHRDFNLKYMDTLGFGYRGKYLFNTLTTLHRIEAMLSSNEAPEKFAAAYGARFKPLWTSLAQNVQSSFLDRLKKSSLDRILIRNFLIETFAGVGPKVADCICLYGLHFFDRVPIDVRMMKLMTTGDLRLEIEFGERPVKKRKGPGPYEAYSKALTLLYPDSPGLIQLFIYASNGG